MAVWLVTGGAGFIGGNFAISAIEQGHTVINVDSLTYAGHLATIDAIIDHPKHHFAKVDIRDRESLDELLTRYQPDAIVHFAAESHVDRSIEGPRAFFETNVMGTLNLCEAAVSYRDQLPSTAADAFRFLHVSTDEVYGSLGESGAFTETTPYAPNSPYSASKAGSDHVVRSFFHTYGLSTVTTNCSNNYGPRQFPEKLIPLVISNALAGRPLPVYGDGSNIRDWLYVEDHCRAIRMAIAGVPGETYNVGGNAERTNLCVVESICDVLDRLVPAADGLSRRRLIEFVTDRPGHDFRYAIDASKISRDLGWKPEVTFDEGLTRTVQWYLDHPGWTGAVGGVWQREAAQLETVSGHG